MSRHTGGSIEQRLHALQVEMPGRRFTPRQIERYTGVEHRTIEKIEQSAIRKLRRAVSLAHPRLFAELA